MLGGAQRPPVHPLCAALGSSSSAAPKAFFNASGLGPSSSATPKAFFNASGLGPSSSAAPQASSSAAPQAFFNAAGLKPTEAEVLRGNSNASAEARSQAAAEAAAAAKIAEQRARIMRKLAVEDADFARAQQRALERKSELDAELKKWGDHYPLHQEIEMAQKAFLRAVDHLPDGIPQQQVETFIAWFKESAKTRSRSSKTSEVNACADLVREIKQSLAKLIADCTLAQQEARVLQTPQDPVLLIIMSEQILAHHQDFYDKFATLEKEMKSVRVAITAAEPRARKAFNPPTQSIVVSMLDVGSMTKEELREALAMKGVKTTGMNRVELLEALETAIALDAMAGHSLDTKKKAVKGSVPTLPSTMFSPEGGSSHNKHDGRDILRERGSQEIGSRGPKVVRERSTKGDFD